MAEYELKNAKLTRNMLVGISVILFGLSLTQQAFHESGSSTSAIIALLMGWMEVFGVDRAGPFVALAWFANPFLLFTWIFTLLGVRALTRTFATIALCLGVGFLFGRYVVVDEGGSGTPITGYALGYWLWLGSLTCAFLGSLVPRPESRL